MPDPLAAIQCALCEKPIEDLNSAFRATGDFLPKDDPLNKYANVPLHWSCYANWPERPRFARHYVNAWIKANRKNPFWWKVHDDEDLYIAVNPEPPIEEAVVRLVSFGDEIRIPLPKWPQWLEHPDAITPNLPAPERKALNNLLPKLRQLFPDDRAVVFAIDPNEKRARARAK